MERLTADLRLILSDASLSEKQSIEQLTARVAVLSDTIKRDAIALPKRINDIITGHFLSIGWDLKWKMVKKAQLFNSSSLLTALQNILAEVENWAPVVQPTAQELASLSVACAKLWDLDVHRLVPGRDYAINLQRGKGAYDKGDFAKDPLFTFVDERALSKPTYAAFVALLDNYSAHTGVSEVVTPEELAENVKFLELVMDTAVMQYAHQYLLRKGLTKATERAAFIQELNQLWFGLYKRKVANDSSGFEHVFVGEITNNAAIGKENEIIGFHNWIYMYLEERKVGSTFDYQGFIRPRRNNRPATSDPTLDQLVTIQFKWQNATKSVGSSFIGTSPEFELALYTLSFYSGQEENIVSCGPYKVKMTCYTYNMGPKKYIATSFPSEAPLDEDEAASRIQSSVRARNNTRSAPPPSATAGRNR